MQYCMQITLVNDLLQSIDSGSIISVAFNTVNHVTLLAIFRSEFSVTATTQLDCIVSFQQIVLCPCQPVIPVAPVSHNDLLLFTTYVALIGQLVNSYSISYHKYADDT